LQPDQRKKPLGLGLLRILVRRQEGYRFVNKILELGLYVGKSSLQNCSSFSRYSQWYFHIQSEIGFPFFGSVFKNFLRSPEKVSDETFILCLIFFFDGFSVGQLQVF
jgi:hypothetical protein